MSGWMVARLDRRYFTAAKAAFHEFPGQVSGCQRFDSLSAGKAGVTEIGRKRYRDVTHPPFSLRRLTLLCEELSYFD